VDARDSAAHHPVACPVLALIGIELRERESHHTVCNFEQTVAPGSDRRPLLPAGMKDDPLIPEQHLAPLRRGFLLLLPGPHSLVADPSRTEQLELNAVREVHHAALEGCAMCSTS